MKIEHWTSLQCSRSSAIQRCAHTLPILLRLPCFPLPLFPQHQGQRTTRSVLKAFVTATGGYNGHLAREGCVMSGSSTMWVSEVLSGDKVLFATDSSRVTSDGGGEDDRPGRFKLWVAPPGRWHLEVNMGSQQMSATCDGDFIWRNYWLGPTPAKGPVRPLRRLLEVRWDGRSCGLMRE